MRLSTLLSGFLLFASLASASTLPYMDVGTAPCVNSTSDPTVTTGGITYDAVGPVDSSFQCGGFLITNISGVADLAVSFYCNSGLGGVCFFTVNVDPINAELGWSYGVGWTPTGPTVFAVDQVILPPLNHVTSGSPSVTEHVCTGPCNGNDGFLTVGTDSSVATGLFPGGMFADVAVFPGDIKGGAISGLDTIFVTPEPVSGILLASGLFGLVLCRRKRFRNSSRLLCAGGPKFASIAVAPLL
jgi:hypothetical protein